MMRERLGLVLLVSVLLAPAASAGQARRGSTDGAPGVAPPGARSAAQTVVRSHKKLGWRTGALDELSTQLRMTRAYVSAVERGASQGSDQDALGSLEAHVAKLSTLLEQVQSDVADKPALAAALAQVEPRFTDLFDRVDAILADTDSASRVSKARDLASELPTEVRANLTSLKTPTVLHELLMGGGSR